MYDYLWKQPATTDFALPVLNEESLLLTEQALGVKLPQSFIDFNLIQNGGEITVTHFQLQKSHSELFIYELFGIDPVLGIGLSHQLQKEWLIPQNLIIISGDEDDWLALDYRKSTHLEPKVVWYDASIDKIYTIAKNFEDFIELLVDPPFEYTAEDFDES